MRSIIQRAIRTVLLVGGVWTGALKSEIVEIYTSRTAWESAVGVFSVETFNTAPVGPLINSPASVGLLTIEFPSRAFGDPRIVGQGPVDGSPALEGVVGIDGNEFFGDLPAYNRLILPGQATAFGADFSSASSAGQLLINFNGQLIDLATYLPPPGNGFFGVISSTVFDTVTITGSSTSIDNPGEIFEMDNISFNSAPPALPEPASYVVLCCGIAVVALRCRNRNASRV